MAYIIVFRKLQDAISATAFPTIYFKLKQDPGIQKYIKSF